MQFSVLKLQDLLAGTGHGGKNAAIISNDTVLPSIMKQKQFQEYVARPAGQRDPQLLAQAMADGFVQCDAEMRPKIPPPDTSGTRPHQPARRPDASLLCSGALSAVPSALREAFGFTPLVFSVPLTVFDGACSLATTGTTAVAVFITPTHFICANAGDSRSVVSTHALILRPVKAIF